MIEQVRSTPPGYGLNALTGEFGDLFADGVIDPLRVTRLTIQHAASVVALMLTTEALVAEEQIARLVVHDESHVASAVGHLRADLGEGDALVIEIDPGHRAPSAAERQVKAAGVAVECLIEIVDLEGDVDPTVARALSDPRGRCF